MKLEKKIMRWLSSQRTPPINLWYAAADVNFSVSMPEKERWDKVWEEFKNLYINNFSGKLNINFIKLYFKVEWQKLKLSSHNKSSSLEEKWYKIIKRELRGKKVFKHVKLPESTMHLDIFCPELMLAFEIQGEQHWKIIEKFGGLEGFTLRQERDARKRELCSNLGIRLIEITRSTPQSFIFYIRASIRHN